LKIRCNDKVQFLVIQANIEIDWNSRQHSEGRNIVGFQHIKNYSKKYFVTVS